MQEVRCPVCGRLLKKVEDPPKPREKEIIIVHCNKCNIDIEVEV
jgi:C4-type Zn-finger protein